MTVYFFILYAYYLRIITGGLLMKLSKKVLILWFLRLTALNFLIIPFVDWSIKLSPALFLIIFMANLIVLLYLYLRYQSMSINTDRNIIISSGVFIRKETHIKPCRIYAVKRIRSPLEVALNLTTLLIYCEGSRFLIPPVTHEAKDRIIQLMIQSKKRGNKY